MLVLLFRGLVRVVRREGRTIVFDKLGLLRSGRDGCLVTGLFTLSMVRLVGRLVVIL